MKTAATCETVERSDRSTESLPQSEADSIRRVSFGEAFRFWLKLGFISFGGPAGQIAIMHREMVERRRWISEDRFLHALNYCMLLPGPEAQQLAIYVGWLLHNVRGGIVAGGLFVLPSIFVLLGLSYLYAAHGGTAAVAGALYGFRPVVVAIVCEAVFRIGRRVIRRRFDCAISAAAFAGIYLLGVAFPVIVILAALVGWLGSRLMNGQEGLRGRTLQVRPPEQRSIAKTEKAGHAMVGSNTDLVIDDDSPAAPHTLPSLRRSVMILLTGLFLWLVGLAIFAGSFGIDSLFVHEYGFFTKAAFVTFGGAYAVLAYVSQAAVNHFGWLSQAQTVDGLALAETTPGPLIMVVQFVAFMAAWNHPVGELSPLTSAILGALLTTFVTFLPSFLFIFLGAPYIEVLRSHRGLDAALRGVTAAVVGVVLNLALVFGTAVLFPIGVNGSADGLAATIAVVAFVALWRFRADVLWLVIAGGLVGVVVTAALSS